MAPSSFANAVSIAPGFMIGNVIVLAGVPDVMQVMLDDVTPRLRTGARMLTATIKLLRAEGDVADLFATHQQKISGCCNGQLSVVRGRPHLHSTCSARNRFSMLESARASLEEKLIARGLL